MKRRNFISSIIGFFAIKEIAVNLAEEDVLYRILKKGRETINNYEDEIIHEDVCCLRTQKNLSTLTVRPFKKSAFVDAYINHDRSEIFRFRLVN